MTNQIGSAFVILSLAVFSEVIDGYLLTRPRDTVALSGDRVELDCVTNTSLSVDWRLIRYGGNGNKNDWISRGKQKRPNVSEAFRILTTKLGQFALVIDPMLMSHAGRYECDDREGAKPSVAEVTLLNGTPSCQESVLSPSRKIVCTFDYAGNRTPELEWVILKNSSWNAPCNAANDTVKCIFESHCTTDSKSETANTTMTICSEENKICGWVTSDVSSSVGLLQIKGQNKTVGYWHCPPTGVSAATQPSLAEEDRDIRGTLFTTKHAVVSDSLTRTVILLLISVGVTSTAIILLLFILHKKYGICRKNRIPHDALYNRVLDSVDPAQTQIETITAANGSVNTMAIYSLAGSTGEEDSSVYAQVKKKKAVLPKTQANGHDNGIFENSIYGYTQHPGQTTTDNFETDGIIYTELGQFPRNASGRIQGAHVASSEGFNTSLYASIDHNLRAPPLLQQSQSHHRHPN